MVNLWTFGGLSFRELALRTWRETWEDAVFGQAARLAFYHFLAIFPSMLLLFFLLVKFPEAGSQLRATLSGSLGSLLPNQASAVMQNTIERLNATAMAGMGLWTAGLGATWAAINGTWALMGALNTAYEVTEKRPLWKEVGTAFLLTCAVAVIFVLALGLATYGAYAAKAIVPSGAHSSLLGASRYLRWPVLAALLVSAFALFYRFGPNLEDREWQWSTPGAVLGVILWLLATWLIHLYFERVHSYHVVYGPLEGVAMLLLWLYFTSAAILIGGEMNSEIEKASEGKRRRPDKHRDGR